MDSVKSSLNDFGYHTDLVDNYNYQGEAYEVEKEEHFNKEYHYYRVCFNTALFDNRYRIPDHFEMAILG